MATKKKAAKKTATSPKKDAVREVKLMLAELGITIKDLERYEKSLN
jgi:hypothetical protein